MQPYRFILYHTVGGEDLYDLKEQTFTNKTTIEQFLVKKDEYEAEAERIVIIKIRRGMTKNKNGFRLKVEEKRSKR